MDRLTNKREADVQRKDYENRLANGYPRNIPEERFLRLAAYEDTGLTPEQCKVATEMEDVLIDEYFSWDRMRELIKADKEGRVVVLPCKVGDTVYAIFAGKIVEQTICKIIINGSTKPRIWVERHCSYIATSPKRWDLSVKIFLSPARKRKKR